MARQELNQNEKDLLNFSAGDLIPMLEENTELSHVKQKAFDYYDSKAKQIYQVQVTVTRNESDFLEDFQTEEMANE
jgi:hypothetical protein